MTEPVKEAHTAIFCGPTSCGKSKKAIELLQNEYLHHFEYIVILCPTLRDNKTYQECVPLWEDDDVFLINPKDQLLEYIEKFSNRFRGFETLFIVDDAISDKHLDEKRTKLLELAISGRHRGHSLWLLSQSYTAVPKNLRRQLKQLFVWHLQQRSDWRIFDDETNVIDDASDWKSIREKLKGSKHGHLFLRLEHPRGWALNVE